MKTIRYGFALITIFLFGVGQLATAQTIYSISDSKANSMKLSGTSSMHDWDMKARTFTGEAQFGFKKGDNQHLTSVKELSFCLPATNLTSDKKGLDKNAYEALKTNRHKDILYTLQSAAVTPEKDGKFRIAATGNLTIAGITREVTMDVFCVVNKDHTISCTGSDTLNMTDYKVTPPSFMFGAMKTGDAITLDFTVVYKNQNSALLSN